MTRRPIITGLVAVSALVAVLLVPGTSDAASRRPRLIRTPRVATVPTTAAVSAPADVLPTSSAIADPGLTLPTPPTFPGGFFGLPAPTSGGDGLTPPTPSAPNSAGGIFGSGPIFPNGIFPGGIFGSGAASTASPQPATGAPTAAQTAQINDDEDDDDDGPIGGGGPIFGGGGFGGNLFQFIQQILQAVFSFLCRLFGGPFCAST